MNKIQTCENQTKHLYLQILVDGCIIVLLSVIVLSIYEYNWSYTHTSKDNIYAIHFDMFSTYYNISLILFAFIAPIVSKFISSKKLMHRFTDKKQLPKKFVRILKIILSTALIILFFITISDKYSRVEFYDNGSIIEYNKENQIISEYNYSDIEFVELRTNHNFGKHISYWTEAVISVNDKNFILKEKNYIVPDDYGVNPDKSLYGLSKVKNIFSDKIKINNEDLYTLLETEYLLYTKGQAKKLCEIFEIDYEETMLWLEEEYDIILED